MTFDLIQQRAGTLHARRGLTWLLVLVPLVLGYVIGLLVKVGKYVWAAFIEGFNAGSRIE